MSDSRHLRVLSAAEDLAVAVLSVVPLVNARRAPGVRGQLARSVTAIAANVAEAANLGTDPNFKRQLRLALASANETGSHLRVLERTGAIPRQHIWRCENKRVAVCKMLVNLIRAIEEREAHEEEERRNGKPRNSQPRNGQPR
ncbi:four helix bundle protein [Gemmatimonas sp. UBA7669]|uniref:four helix bundle protein n=1 Tax=Gemmatimonas sp. UBA7669 TaxID=1946568 RepID=UPI0025C32B47|nr:four helix bundle protein [Gemmatimonas sp. UBA7669]